MATPFNLENIGDYQQMAFGDNGSEHLTGTDVGGAALYRAVTALADTVVTLEQPKGDTTLVLTIPAGGTVVGHFTSIELTSGDCLAYIG